MLHLLAARVPDTVFTCLDGCDELGHGRFRFESRDGMTVPKNGNAGNWKGVQNRSNARLSSFCRTEEGCAQPLLTRGSAHVRKPNTAGESTLRPPHPPLTDYYASEEERRGYLQGIFDRTAADYDRIERVLAIGTGPWYRRQALLRAGLRPGMRVLDVGVGTGLVASEVACIVGDGSLVTGIDPSAGMMSKARLPSGANLVQGRAEAIPLADSSVDFLSMGYVLRHLSDLNAAFDEFHRVLKPGGRICLLEITRPGGRVQRAILKAYMRVLVPVLARVVGKSADTVELWRYYWDSIDACVSPENVVSLLQDSGFENVDHCLPHRRLSICSEYQGVRSRGS